MPGRLAELSLIASKAQGKIDELRTLAEPQREDEEDLVPSEAWAKLVGRKRQSVLQSAKARQRLTSPGTARELGARVARTLTF